MPETLQGLTMIVVHRRSLLAIRLLLDEQQIEYQELDTKFFDLNAFSTMEQVRKWWRMTQE